MAQHINADKIENRAVQKIVASIRNQRYFKTSFKYFDVPHDDFKETPTDEVYACNRRVPESIVYGGQAYFEIHTEPRKDLGRRVTNIYLVA